jgi:Lon protease-like protein
MLLPDCTLFPHGGLPLHIFEPRYREMLREALEGHCFFAVARLSGDETAAPAQCASQVGTIGLVRASHEQADGTSQLLLHGVMRVPVRINRTGGLAVLAGKPGASRDGHAARCR